MKVVFKNGVTLCDDLSDRLIHDILIEHTDHAVIRELALKTLHRHGNVFLATRIARILEDTIKDEIKMQDGDMNRVILAHCATPSKKGSTARQQSTVCHDEVLP